MALLQQPPTGMYGLLSGGGQSGGVLGAPMGLAPPVASAMGPQGAADGGIWSKITDWMQANPQTVSALAAGLLSGNGSRDALGRASAGYAQAAPLERRQQGEMKWLRAQGGIDPATEGALKSSPELTDAMFSAAIMPHPKQLLFDPVNGGAHIFEPFSGTDTVAGGPPQNQDGYNAFRAKPVTLSDGSQVMFDPLSQAVRPIPGAGPKPTNEQATASGALNEAAAANDILKQTETGETGAVTSALRGVQNVPGLGVVSNLRGEDAKRNDAARQQFLQAIRGLAISAKLNPDSAEYSGDAMFAKYGDPPAVVQQKAQYRERILQDLATRAGPYAQAPTPATALPPPDATVAAPAAPDVEAEMRRRGLLK